MSAGSRLGSTKQSLFLRGTRGRLLAVCVAAACVWADPALAAKPTPSPDFNDPVVQRPSEPPVMNVDQETVGITKPAKVDRVERAGDDYFYRYRHAVTGRTGITADTNSAGSGGGTPFLLGAIFMLTTEELESYEIGADLLSTGKGTVHADLRTEFSRGDFRPFVKYGAGMIIDPSDQLAAFLRYQNYQLRGTVGLEQLINDPASFRLEIDLALALSSVQLTFAFGYVWAW